MGYHLVEYDGRHISMYNLRISSDIYWDISGISGILYANGISDIKWDIIYQLGYPINGYINGI